MNKINKCNDENKFYIIIDYIVCKKVPLILFDEFFILNILRYNTSKSKYANILSSSESIDVIHNENNDHVPLCSINDVQLRFLIPDDLTEVGIFFCN